MTIASTGAAGTGTSSTSASSFTLATATNAFANGDFGELHIVTDNISTTTGVTNDHQGVSGGTGVWRKILEYTYSPTGAKTGITITNSGTATHVALLNTTATTLDLVTTCTSQAINTGGTVDVPAWKWEINNPT